MAKRTKSETSTDKALPPASVSAVMAPTDLPEPAAADCRRKTLPILPEIAARLATALAAEERALLLSGHHGRVSPVWKLNAVLDRYLPR